MEPETYSFSDNSMNYILCQKEVYREEHNSDQATGWTISAFIPTRSLSFFYGCTVHSDTQSDIKKRELLKNPTKIEEIQKKKLLTEIEPLQLAL